MLGLLPRDHWQHNLIDSFQAIATGLIPIKQDKTLTISGLGSCIPVGSGRSGLVAAIKALNLKPGSRVAVPLYCCHVVFKAIIAANCLPCFIDVDPETFCLSLEDLSAKQSQIDAVIAVHMFGNLCDMSGLKEVMHNKPIIEDCAQALGSKIEGRNAGLHGDIAFFSFRSGKYLSVGEGGALFTSNEELYNRLLHFVAEMPISSYFEECVHVFKTYIKSVLRSKPLYGVIGYPLWKTLNKKINLSEKSGITLKQIYRTDLTSIKKRLSLLDSIITQNRANAAYFSNALKLDLDMLCLEKYGFLYNRYHYPITFPSEKHRDFIAAYLFTRNIDTIKYIDNVVDMAVKYYGYTGGCPIAENLSNRVLIIPSYHSLRDEDIKRIAHCINAGWRKAKYERV